MIRSLSFAMMLSFFLMVGTALLVYYDVIPIDPSRTFIGGFAICMILGTSPVWWGHLRGTNVRQ